MASADSAPRMCAKVIERRVRAHDAPIPYSLLRPCGRDRVADLRRLGEGPPQPHHLRSPDQGRTHFKHRDHVSRSDVHRNDEPCELCLRGAAHDRQLPPCVESAMDGWLRFAAARSESHGTEPVTISAFPPRYRPGPEARLSGVEPANRWTSCRNLPRKACSC